MALISVIVPVYNVEKYIHRCVDSILSQTFPDFQLLLVDDGSKDKSGAICDEYAAKDSRIRVIHQENKGQAAARNLALDWVFANSDSEYISFVDSDDWVHPQYLELLYRGLNDHGVNISQCLHLETDGSAETQEVTYQSVSVSPEQQYTQWYSAFFWGKLFRRSCLEAFHFPEGQIFEDVAVWYKLLFAEQRIAIVQAALYYYYFNADSTVHRSWTPPRMAQVKAWEDQLTFVSEKIGGSVLDHALRRNLGVLRSQYQEIQSSDQIDVPEKKRFGKYVLHKMRHILRRYDSEIKRIGLYSDYYAFAYPNPSMIRSALRLLRSPKKAAAACKDRVLRALTRPVILFESVPAFGDNVRPVYDEMIRRGLDRDYDLVWMDAKAFPVFLRADGSVASFESIKPGLVRRLYYWALCHHTTAVICCNNFHFPTDPENCTVFYLSHGTPMKSLRGYHELPDYIDYVLAASKAVAPICSEQFSVSPDKVFSLGFPRNDVFNTPAREIRSMLGTTCSHVIVWYPTYRQNPRGKTTASTHALPIIHDAEAAIRLNKAAKEADTLIVLKPHFAQDLSLIRDLGLENIRFISDSFFVEHKIASYSFVNSCDALITDYSSIYFDYTLADKPIAVTWDDLEEYRRDPGFAVDLDVYLKGAVKVFNAADLIAFIQDVAAGRDVLQTERREIRDLVNYSTDGKNTDRVVDFILKTLSLEKYCEAADPRKRSDAKQ